MEQNATPHSSLRNILRRQWTRLLLHNIHFAEKNDRFDALYRVRNPWEMNTEAQKFRFTETNRLIQEQFGSIGSLLEVGCGEGHQSEELMKTCSNLVGIDVSERAVERARLRCPAAQFVTCDLAAPELAAYGGFDLVVACEVLYYVRDVPAALRQLERLGRGCLVTYYAGPREKLDHHLLAIPGAQTATWRHGTSSWTAVWWRPVPTPA